MLVAFLVALGEVEEELRLEALALV